MSPFQEPGNARQLSVIESAYSQELDSATDHGSSDMSTKRKDFAGTGFSFSASTPATTGCPEIPSRISSLNLDPCRTSSSQYARRASKDIEKSNSTSSSSFHGSGPKIAEVADHGKQDPFAQESEGGVQYKTMAWWYAFQITSTFPQPLAD